MQEFLDGHRATGHGLADTTVTAQLQEVHTIQAALALKNVDGLKRAATEIARVLAAAVHGQHTDKQDLLHRLLGRVIQKAPQRSFTTQDATRSASMAPASTSPQDPSGITPPPRSSRPQLPTQDSMIQVLKPASDETHTNSEFPKRPSFAKYPHLAKRPSPCTEHVTLTAACDLCMHHAKY